jgi:flagellin
MGFQQGFRVNTNTASLNTYRSYGNAQAGLERNIERLSSGLRINRAADDSAGLSISNRMSNQVRGMQQSNRNVQQGNNMMQTAEGGLNEISNILGRMRELAVQSASDGVNADDRASIDLEFQQLKAEITRIGNATEYNGMKLINGSKAKGLKMNGASVHTDNSAIGTDKVATDSVRLASFTEQGTYAIRENSTNTLELYKQDANNNYSLVDTFVKSEGNIAGGNEIHFDDAGIVFKLDAGYENGDLTATFTDDGSTGNNVNGDGIGTLGTEHKLVVAEDGDSANFTTIQVGSNNDSTINSTTASDGVDQSGASTENRLTFNLADTTSVGLGISTVDLDSLGDAQSAINSLDAAIQKVNDERGNIGSLQNRLEFTSSNLMNSIQNNSASLSTIRDADFAVEAADLARNQILTQSSSAMLAQANSLSQSVLGLIR